VLVHLIAGDTPVDEVLADRETIDAELRAWNPALLERPMIPVVTKLDLPEARATFETLRERIPGVRGISAATGEGVRELIYAAWETIRATPLPPIAEPEPAQIELQADEPFAIHREDGVYVVSGERVERLARMTDFDSDEALARFEQVLAKMGVDKKLRELGVREGDTVRIAGVEFDYS
jgi:GTP-binding protein